MAIQLGSRERLAQALQISAFANLSLDPSCIAMVRALFLLAGAATADPAQPHLSQAWTARSVGDGMPGVEGNEAYFFGDNEMHHLWDYGEQGSKIWTCPKGSYSCIEYYLKLNGPNCCKCENAGEPKMWDIAKGGLLTKVGFVGFEDTTELDGNPVAGAEHWATSSVLPKVLTVTYDYFVHREGDDVISHRIDFNTSVQQAGSILYGDFAVAHDLDAHRQKFAQPEECKGNILDCCDDREKIMSTWFKHVYALEQAEKAAVAV